MYRSAEEERQQPQQSRSQQLLLQLSVLVFLLLQVVDAKKCKGLPKSYDGVRTNIKFSRPGKPDRYYKIYTPSKYNAKKSSNHNVLLLFHGWCGKAEDWTGHQPFQQVADKYNYVLVALQGLGESEGECSSWGATGSNKGVNPGGTTDTCDTSIGTPNQCYGSCGTCRNRCPWTHCQDNDVQFVHDLLKGGRGFTNSLSKKICFDKTNVFVAGESNGALMVYELLQNALTADLFRAASPMIGTPQCGYNFAGPTKVPLMSITGMSDNMVPPASEPWPGTPTETCVTSTASWRQRFVSSHRIVTTWAKAGGCNVPDENAFPTGLYPTHHIRLGCRTFCNLNKPYALDCAFPGAHELPDFALEAAIQFFNLHACARKKQKCGNAKPCCSGRGNNALKCHKGKCR